MSQQPQPVPSDSYPVYTRPEPRNGFGLAAIILGLIGLLFGFVPFTGFIAVALGIAGLAFGLAARGRLKRRVATNGKTTWTGIIASLLAVALGIWGITIVFGAVEELDKDLTCIGEADTVEQMEACQ